MNRSVCAILVVLIVPGLLAGCAAWSPDRDVLYQHGDLGEQRLEHPGDTIPLNTVLRRSNFGFGQLADTPGLVVLQGKDPLHITGSGRIKKPRYNEPLTSFMVTEFDTDSQYETLRPRNLNQLVTYIESVIGRKTASYAIHVAGRFHFVEFSAHSGDSPSNRIRRNLSGQLIGFRLTEKVNARTRVRYPFVFVNRTRQFGGLVRTVTVGEASITLDRLSRRNFLTTKPQPGESPSESRTN